MSKTLIMCVELDLGGSSKVYLSTSYYTTTPSDTPASQVFQPRLVDQLEFERSVDCVIWSGSSRGSQSFGAIKIANPDGAFDSYAGSSLRDFPVLIKRGYDDSAYSTFTDVASLIIDRVEFSDELIMTLYVRDLSAKLERSLQQSLYPITISNSAIRSTPKPVCFGRCFQIPLTQPETTGNGHYDFHDNLNFIGAEEVFDNGANLTESLGYRRSRKTNISGIERLTSSQGKQCATVLGAFKIASTEINETFASLANWTESNGGVAGRDASIVSNRLSMVNTAGALNLSIAYSAATPTGTDSTYWYYQFSCVSVTSGYAQFRFSSGTVVQEKIDTVGTYSGIIKHDSDVVPEFWAVNGSNCNVLIDDFILRKVTPLSGLLDAVKYFATNDTDVGGKGPLALTDLNSSSISSLEALAPYEIGFFTNQQIQVAEVLDQIMSTYAGWWYIDRLGKLTVGRLSAPTGTPSFFFNEKNIMQGMRIDFDEAKNLSNVGLAKKNFSVYDQSEIVSSLRYVTMNDADKSANISLANDPAYESLTATASGTGAVRSTPVMFGTKLYIEVPTINIGGTDGLYLGFSDLTVTVSNVPGINATSTALRANGSVYQDGFNAAFASSFTGGDVVGLAIDGTQAAYGSKSRGFKMFWSINGAWQVNNPNLLTTFYSSEKNAKGIASFMFGSTEAADSWNVNFGQKPFNYTPPTDYLAPAFLAAVITSEYREKYISSVSLNASYEFAEYSEALAISGSGYSAGMPTLLTKRADLETEMDRRCTMYAAQRFFYTFDVLLEAEDADNLNPGDVISVSYPRFSLSSKMLKVISVKGGLLENKVTIKAWG